MTRVIRPSDQLIDAYQNPLHSQQRVFEELLRALDSGQPHAAAQAAAVLALKLEHHGIETDFSLRRAACDAGVNYSIIDEFSGEDEY